VHPDTSQLPSSGLRLTVDRRGRTALIEVAWPDGGEVFFVADGDRSVGIMAFDESDDSHREPRLHVIPRPYGWSMDVSDDELLLGVWQIMGEQR
jgi:hypothetical protein